MLRLGNKAIDIVFVHLAVAVEVVRRHLREFGICIESPLSSENRVVDIADRILFRDVLVEHQYVRVVIGRQIVVAIREILLIPDRKGGIQRLTPPQLVEINISDH